MGPQIKLKTIHCTTLFFQKRRRKKLIGALTFVSWQHRTQTDEWLCCLLYDWWCLDRCKNSPYTSEFIRIFNSHFSFCEILWLAVKLVLFINPQLWKVKNTYGHLESVSLHLKKSLYMVKSLFTLSSENSYLEDVPKCHVFHNFYNRFWTLPPLVMCLWCRWLILCPNVSFLCIYVYKRYTVYMIVFYIVMMTAYSCVQTAKIWFVCVMKKHTNHVCTVSGVKCSLHYFLEIQFSLTTETSLSVSVLKRGRMQI